MNTGSPAALAGTEPAGRIAGMRVDPDHLLPSRGQEKHRVL